MLAVFVCFIGGAEDQIQDQITEPCEDWVSALPIEAHPSPRGLCRVLTIPCE